MAEQGDNRGSVEEIEVLLRSRYPILYVVTWEETRVVAAIAKLGAKLNKKVYEWSCNMGLAAHNTPQSSQKHAPGGSKDPLVALREVTEQLEPALYIFHDFHPFLSRNNFTVIRALREIAQKLTSSYKSLVLIAPSLCLPPDLQKEITVVDFRLPGRAELGVLLDHIAGEVKGNPRLKVDLSGDAREELLKAAQGLTLSEAENVFAKSLVIHKRLGVEQVADILSEKRQIIRKSELLDYCDPEVALTDVGGLAALKDWLTKRKLAFTDRARDFGLPAPKGVLLLGVQGCGKSLCAKAVSALWNLPLLRLDVGRLFSSLVGSSEENIRRAIAIAESVAPCILWVDEIDKAFGSLMGSSTDSGTSQRVLGAFLTWLAEKDSATFVVATANNINVLPPELLRKGRFDEIFFVDLPDTRERANIFTIHLKRRERDPRMFRIDELAAASEGFSGAEIEQAVISALFDAFYDGGRELTTDDMLKSLAETVPLSRTMQESITRLREWCLTRARSASDFTGPRGDGGRYAGLLEEPAPALVEAIGVDDARTS